MPLLNLSLRLETSGLIQDVRSRRRISPFSLISTGLQKEVRRMKYASVRVYAILAAATLGLMSVGHPVVVEAQSSRLTANIPFDFYVGRDRLPAGKYDM